MQHIRGVTKRDILFYVFFSVTNLKMKRWYSFYYERVVIGQQLVGQLQMPESFGLVPWKHHVLIISKCQTIDEALFYINKTIEGGWSRSRLESQLETSLYKSQGAAITNFDNTLSNPQNHHPKSGYWFLISVSRSVVRCKI